MNGPNPNVVRHAEAKAPARNRTNYPYESSRGLKGQGGVFYILVLREIWFGRARSTATRALGMAGIRGAGVITGRGEGSAGRDVRTVCTVAGAGAGVRGGRRAASRERRVGVAGGGAMRGGQRGWAGQAGRQAGSAGEVITRCRGHRALALYDSKQGSLGVDTPRWGASRASRASRSRRHWARVSREYSTKKQKERGAGATGAEREEKGGGQRDAQVVHNGASDSTPPTGGGPARAEAPKKGLPSAHSWGPAHHLIYQNPTYACEPNVGVELVIMISTTIFSADQALVTQEIFQREPQPLLGTVLKFFHSYGWKT
ncbi:hypothetical protein DFH09DRAFT_1089243 [Mycena vulgaris]|nr:hypothetical protein DFH09DRAFT_1089243 [Mycena vulgaris]